MAKKKKPLLLLPKLLLLPLLLLLPKLLLLLLRPLLLLLPKVVLLLPLLPKAVLPLRPLRLLLPRRSNSSSKAIQSRSQDRLFYRLKNPSIRRIASFNTGKGRV